MANAVMGKKSEESQGVTSISSSNGSSPIKTPVVTGTISTTVGAVVKIDETGRTIVAPFRKYHEANRTRYSFDSELTFTPKLNQTSLKLAKERGDRWKEAYGVRQAAQLAETEKLFTFRPHVSERSKQIVEKLKTTFKSRNLKQKHKKAPADENSTSKASKQSPSDTSNTRLPLSTAISVSHLLTSATTSATTSAGLPATSKSCCNVATLPEIKSSSVSSLTPVEVKTKTLNQSQKPDRYAKKYSSFPPPASSLPEGNKLHRIRKSSGFSQQYCDVPSIGRIRRARHIAERAMVEKKVFLCLGPYPAVRQSLRRRGWVEKNYHGPLGNGDRAMRKKIKKIVQSVEAEKEVASESDVSSSDSDEEPEDSDLLVQAYREEFGVEEDEQYSMASRAVRDCHPNFIWTCRPKDVAFRHLRRDQIACHYRRNAAFTTKVGICTHLRNLRWFGDVHPDTFFPRCYRLCADEEKSNFINDFRLMAASNILKWTASHELRSRSQKCGPVVSCSAVRFAVKVCEDFVTHCEHQDIDEPEMTMTEEEWNSLVQHSYQLTQQNGILEPGKLDIPRIHNILSQLSHHLPQFEMDGMRNVWIIKPGAKSRGRGIVCMNKLEDILALASSPTQKEESKWIVQKYIERPLLIYNTKFDIRQWFLVTDWNPLTYWMYKDSYLRFSSRQFTLDDLDVSVHLCNNSIQKYYENVPRASELPADNLWFHERFKDFLAERGAETAWDEIIYPGMKKAIVNVLLTTQEDMECRKNSFELYGADFMITEGDYRPWLIEVNCSPAMGASGEVTARLCPQVIEDTIKVVIDRKLDKSVEAERFELALKQPTVSVPAYMGVHLSVEGTKLPRPKSPRPTRASHDQHDSDDDPVNVTKRRREKSLSPPTAVLTLKKFPCGIQMVAARQTTPRRSLLRQTPRQQSARSVKPKLSVSDLAVLGAGAKKD